MSKFENMNEYELIWDMMFQHGTTKRQNRVKFNGENIASQYLVSEEELIIKAHDTGVWRSGGTPYAQRLANTHKHLIE